MHLISDISDSIRQMGSGNHFTTDIFDQLHIGSVTEVYQSTNQVNQVRQMLQHNDRCTGHYYMDETLLCVALYSWYDIDSPDDFNQLPAAEKWQISCRPYLLHLQHCQEEPLFRHISQRVDHFSQTHVQQVGRSIKWTALKHASEYFRIPNFWQLFYAQIDENWGQKVCWLLLGYDQSVLIDCIFIKLQNGLLYYW